MDPLDYESITDKRAAAAAHSIPDVLLRIGQGETHLANGHRLDDVLYHEVRAYFRSRPPFRMHFDQVADNGSYAQMSISDITRKFSTRVLTTSAEDRRLCFAVENVARNRHRLLRELIGLRAAFDRRAVKEAALAAINDMPLPAIDQAPDVTTWKAKDPMFA